MVADTTNMFYFLVLMVTPLLAFETTNMEETVSINKPVRRIQAPWENFSTDHVRCFCNLPVCISTGYMCKSKEGGCFSDLHEHRSPHPSPGYRGRHGCLELLRDGEQKSHCDHSSEEASRTPGRRANHPKNLMFCCYHDMCNHVDSPQTKNLLNYTLLGDVRERQDRIVDTTRSQPENPGYTNSEVWFKAATIAVPICGAVILFVLIALAVKILRSENQSSSNRKLGSMYGCHNKYSQQKYNEHLDCILRNPTNSLQQPNYYLNHNDDIHRQIQMPLLVQNEINTHHCGNKNETNAKLNLMQCDSVNDLIESGKSLMLEIEKNTSPKCSQVNLDVNINNAKYSENKYNPSDEKVYPEAHNVI